MKPKLLWLYGICLVLITHVAYAQDLPLPENLQSPNAGSLGKYGDIPVSYYTGTPNISVPLYAINDYGIPLNIILNYDGSGVRVNNMPGWVGQNWSLQAGGVITRTQRGKFADEVNDESFAQGYLHPESRALLDVSNWDSESYFDDLQSQTGGRDTEPDVFTFNFMGHTGKFFLGTDGEWKVASNSNIKVVIDQNDNTFPFNESIVPFNHDHIDVAADHNAYKQIYKITIYDDKGNIYVFGNTDESIEYTVPFFSQFYKGRWTASSWYLTEVYDRFNHLVYTFNYERDDYIAQLYTYERSEYWQTSDESPGYFDYSTCGVGNTSFGTFYNGSLVSPVYLKTIETQRGSIDFNRSTSHGLSYKNDSELLVALSQSEYMDTDNPYFFYYLLPYTNINEVFSKLHWKKLDGITGLQKNIDFNYNDVESSSNNDRLALMDVSVNDLEYEFTYDDLGGLPKLLSKKVDHWGYYRGVYNFQPSGEANSTNNFDTYYNHRSPNTSYLKRGILTRLTYPTKGWTDFEWESHSYSSYLSDDKANLVSTSNTLAGGIRINHIENNDGKGNVMTREFKYVSNYSTNPSSTLSSGILERKPKYYWEDFSLISYTDNQYILDEDLFSTTPAIPLSNASGSYIGYSEVIEIRPQSGHTIYKYTSNAEPDYRDHYNAYSLNPDLTPYAVYNDKSMLRGQLKTVEVRDIYNSLKQRSTNHYVYDSSLFVKGVNLSTKSCDGAGLGFIKGSAYKTYYFDHNLIKQETQSYENGQFLINETAFNYAYYPNITQTNGNQFLQSKKTQTYSTLGSSDQEFILEDYTYTFENTLAIYTELTNTHYFGLLQTDVSKSGVPLSSQKIEYDYFGSDNTILPKRLWSAKGSHSLEERTVIDSYNANSKTVEKSHTPRGSYTQISYFKRHTGSSYETLPYMMFKIEGEDITNPSFLNAKVGEINALGTSHEDILTKQQQVRNHYSNHMVTSYTYYPSTWKVRTITGPDGVTQHYIYDANQRLSKVKDDDGNVLEQLIYNLKSE